MMVGGTQMPPLVSTGDRNAVLRHIRGAQPFRHWWTVAASSKRIQIILLAVMADNLTTTLAVVAIICTWVLSCFLAVPSLSWHCYSGGRKCSVLCWGFLSKKNRWIKPRTNSAWLRKFFAKIGMIMIMLILRCLNNPQSYACQIVRSSY